MSIQSPTSAVPRVDTHSSRVDVLNTKQGRILCVADVRGALSTLNTLAAEHNAIAIIHSGDFGFYEPSSIPSISDRTLKHLLQYSSLLTPQFRSQLLSPSTSPTQLRQLLQTNPDFVLSEFPKLLNGELKFNVPVYTVWGACEDVSILEKIRLAPNSSLSIPDSTPSLAPSTTTQTSSPEVASSYSIPNLTVLDEATTRVLVIGGVRLRLFGLGGAVVSHKLFDNGQGNATIAGGMGTMWTTMLQIGELVDTAQKVYDPTETRLLLTHASPGREGLISQLSLVLKADLTISAGLHFRYGVSYNEFSVNWDPESFRGKLEASRKAFGEVWDAVKNQVEGVVDENQKSLLANALAVANRVPATAPVAGGPAAEETAWKNCWNWNLPDAAFGSLILDIREGRIGSEMKSQGFNFAYRSSSSSSSNSTSQPSTSAPRPTQPQPHQPQPQPQPQPQQSSAPQSQPNMNRPSPVPAAPNSTAPHTVQGVGRGGIHQRGSSSGAMRAGTNRIGFSNYQAAPPSTSAPELESAPSNSTSTEPKQNGTSTEPKSAPSPSASPAPPSANSAPPTGPRNQQNRPPSRQQQQQNPPPAPPAQSSSPAPPTPVQPDSASSSETPAKPSTLESTAETPGEPSNAENTGSIGRSSGRGRGRGGRGRGDGVDRGERSERGGATPGRGNRGRSNGEWRGRGRGGARQASGEVVNGTPSAAAGGAGGVEKPSA